MWVNRKVERNRKIPEKNHLTTRYKQSLACLTCDKRFRELKISDLNHSAMGAALHYNVQKFFVYSRWSVFNTGKIVSMQVTPANIM